jgi:hypothetical protein
MSLRDKFKSTIQKCCTVAPLVQIQHATKSPFFAHEATTSIATTTLKTSNCSGNDAIADATHTQQQAEIHATTVQYHLEIPLRSPQNI